MRRSRYLVAYDIRDPKRLRSVHKSVTGFGFPMQYSVFLCDLTSAERLDLLQSLEDTIDPVKDCIAVINLGDPDDTRHFMFLGSPPVLPRSGPAIL